MMNANIRNVIYMELYSGAKMVDYKYEKMNVAGSIDREFTVYVIGLHLPLNNCSDPDLVVLGSIPKHR
jgi:uncharacterized protein YebE (UPF0316 family)